MQDLEYHLVSLFRRIKRPEKVVILKLSVSDGNLDRAMDEFFRLRGLNQLIIYVQGVREVMFD